MNFSPIKKTVIPLTLITTTLLGFGTPSQAQTINVTIDQNQTRVGTQVYPLNSDPIEMQGRFGGTDNGDGCGFISPTQNVVLNVEVPNNEPINNMAVTIETEGEPTFVIDGPDGRFCVLPDSFSEDGNPKFSGLWLAGQYKIFVGDRTNNTGAANPFILSISRNN